MLPPQRGGEGGGELPYKKDKGAGRKLWKELQIGTKIRFSGRSMICFTH